MTEEEARGALAALMDAEGLSRVDRFRALLLAEASLQNLISAASMDQVWLRHLYDSAQLLRFARSGDRTWIDVGSGAGLPGLVIACSGRFDVTMIEPRRKRVAFLERCIVELNIPRARVLPIRAERHAPDRATDIVSARAVASLPNLLAMTASFSGTRTRFILPRGEHARADVATVTNEWQGVFHVEQSATSATAGIVVADGVKRR